ncbi:GPI19 Phosphatidylinositol N-acetylglucosaminyltransferase subunit GPI19 [Candida maltosa Xu316]|uniref:Phosphatidylinositol N-acetylglucosaminyltransferase subunit, putative n=1 Tax=Candida maltosa (strain Xu316) TaxID=1245528 RepID=M3HSQ9_CANMX|nr:Phosphatidylinositol N-acetylglucosaminyltransferase subunit, putative [Candida maltosa Xu316]
MSSLYLNIINSLSRSSSPVPQPSTSSNEDKLARESDVTVSSTVSNNKYQGFTIYIISTILLISWTFWTILPNFVLDKLLIDHDILPDKYWSLSIPCYFLMLMLFTYWGLALFNLEVMTLDLNDVRCIVDDSTVFPGEERDEIMSASIEYIHTAPSGVWDMPITLVNEVLYGDFEAEE